MLNNVAKIGINYDYSSVIPVFLRSACHILLVKEIICSVNSLCLYYFLAKCLYIT